MKRSISSKSLKIIFGLVIILPVFKTSYANEPHNARQNPNNESIGERAHACCVSSTNLVCQVYGKHCLAFVGICTLAYFGSRYIKPFSSKSSYNNATITQSPPYNEPNSVIANSCSRFHRYFAPTTVITKKQRIPQKFFKKIPMPRNRKHNQYRG